MFLNKKYIFRFSVQICLKHFSLQEEFRMILSKMYVSVNVKLSLILVTF